MELSPLSVAKESLKSRIVKEFVGEKIVDLYTTFTQPLGTQQRDENGNPIGNIINTVFGFASKLVGFAVNLVTSALGWVLRNIWNFLVEAYFEIKSFDFAQTDAEIQKQIESNNQQLFGALGRLAGNGLVSITSVVIAGAVAYKYPVIAGELALRLAEEAGDELRGELVSFLSTTRNVLARNGVLNLFLTARKLRLFNQAPVTKRGEPWIISEQWEKWVHDRVTDQNIRSFVDNFLETVEDRIIETGFVVSYALDDIFRASKLSAKSAMGRERIIEIVPDSAAPNETLAIRGKQELLIPAAQNAILQHKVIRNREVGQIVGLPLSDYVKANPYVRKLAVIFHSVEKPPFRSLDGKRAKKAIYNIPDVKQGLTFNEIKQACPRFTWGKYRATANLSNGRQMAVYGASPGEAEQQLRRMLTLSTANILTLSISEEKDRDPKLKKDAVLLYPAFATLMVRRTDLSDPQYVDLEGKGYAEYTQRVEIWRDQELPGSEPLK